MSAAVVRALTDRAHAAALAAAGRAHVERHYGWAAIAEGLADELAGLAASPPTQASLPLSASSWSPRPGRNCWPLACARSTPPSPPWMASWGWWEAVTEGRQRPTPTPTPPPARTRQ